MRRTGRHSAEGGDRGRKKKTPVWAEEGERRRRKVETGPEEWGVKAEGVKFFPAYYKSAVRQSSFRYGREGKNDKDFRKGEEQREVVSQQGRRH